MFRQYDRTALPVTDTAGVLIGIVTIDDVLDVAEAVTTKEIQRIGGSEALDEPYMQIAMTRMIRKRAPWLTALFLGEMLTATAMTLFEDEISRVVTLALFIPLIISSGGNSGSQAATLVIRALALGEVKLADWWRIVRREVIAGLSMGAILGSIGFLRIVVWSQFLPTYGAYPVLDRDHCGFRASWSSPVGFTHWIYAAAGSSTTRVRSGHILGAICGNACRRDGTDHLLFRRACCTSRNAPVGEKRTQVTARNLDIAAYTGMVRSFHR